MQHDCHICSETSTFILPQRLFFTFSIRSIDRSIDRLSKFNSCSWGQYPTFNQAVIAPLFLTSLSISPHLPTLSTLLPIPHHPINSFPTSRSRQPPAMTIADPQPNQGDATARDLPQSAADYGKIEVIILRWKSTVNNE